MAETETLRHYRGINRYLVDRNAASIVLIISLRIYKLRSNVIATATVGARRSGGGRKVVTLEVNPRESLLHRGITT